MGTEIDLYEFKETLKEYEDDDFIEIVEDKTVGMIRVNKSPKEIKDRLLKMGYQEDDDVLVIIQ